MYKFNCIICNKKYASYQSFWNHKKKYHKLSNESNSNIINETNSNILNETNSNIINETNNNIIDETNSNIIDEPNNNIINDTNSNIIDETRKLYKCNYCCKKFSYQSSRFRHQKLCNKINNNLIQLNNIINKVECENIYKFDVIQKKVQNVLNNIYNSINMSFIS